MSSMRVLLVEDDDTQRQLLTKMIQQADYLCVATDNVVSAKQILQRQTIDIVLSDWKLKNEDGMVLLAWIREHFPDIGFVMATAYGSISNAVAAMQAGADDYLSKPFQRQQLLLALQKASNTQRLKQQNKALTEALSQQNKLVDLIGESPVMQKVFERIRRVSDTGASVLIQGESGTGKELAARALHKLSSRAPAPFIAINCGAIPESLAEAELFGAQKGAFTGATKDKQGVFEAAHQGTLFLDEIGELPLSLQVKLLRALQEQQVTRLGSTQTISVDVRVIAATNRDLATEVAAGRFREDLYYRLNVVPLLLPPLRERQQDIVPLLQHFLSLFAARHHLPAPEISAAMMKQLLNAPWLGNVRELANRVERFILLADEQELLPERPTRAQTTLNTLPDEGLAWEDHERAMLEQAILKANGNRTQAAKLLQLSYKAFLYRLEKYHITVDE